MQGSAGKYLLFYYLKRRIVAESVSASGCVFNCCLRCDRRLKNKEVLDVLQRFHVLGLESSPQVQTRPQSGQLLLYDRAVVKHFRRDVHEWKKKRSPLFVAERLPGKPSAMLSPRNADASLLFRSYTMMHL